MRALVTGGAGFIGSHVVETLLKKKWHIDVIDDLSTGHPKNLPQNELLRFYRAPIDVDSEQMELAHQADYIFHFAATVGVQLVLKSPLDATYRNTRSTGKILRMAAIFEKPILIASSSEVYGRRDNADPLRETMDLRIGPEPRWGYAAAKLLDEFSAMAYHSQLGLPVVAARLFNTIGPRQISAHGMVVPRMIDAALKGGPIVVYGDGTQRRSFAWAPEIADALIALIQKPAAYGQVVNVGCESSSSILNLAFLIQQCVLRRTGIKAGIKMINPSEAYGATFNDIQNRQPCLDKLYDLIGFKPDMGLVEMIDRLVVDRTWHDAGEAPRNA